MNEAEKAPKKSIFKKLSSGYGIRLMVLILICVLMAIFSSGFLTYENIFNVLRSTAVNGIVALAMTYVIVTGGIDLSVGTNVGLGGMICAVLIINNGWNMWLAMLVALVICALIGLLNGMMIHDGNIPAFIATMGSMTITRAVIMLISDARNIPGYPDDFLGIAKFTLGFPGVNELGKEVTFGIPLLALIWIILIVVSFLIIKYTCFGRNVFAIGSNTEAARLSGISVRKTTYGVYIYSAVFCAIGGMLLSSRMASGIPTLGDGYELDAIAAAVIGGASLSGGEGSIGGTVVGAILIAVIRNAGVLLGLNGQITEIVIGGLIIFAVLIDQMSKKRGK